MGVIFWKSLRRMSMVVRIFVLIFLLLLMSLPLFALSPSTLTNANIQRVRCERIAKNALVLEYRPSDEHTQAISELQNLLPLWQQEQIDLLGSHDNQIHLLALQSNADYTSITTAMKAILAKNNPVDPNQIDIIVAHERDYALTVGQMATLLQQDTIARTQAWIILDLVLLGIVSGTTILDQTLLVRKVQEEKEPNGTPKSPGKTD